MSQEMERHEVEAPKGLWEGIEQGMEARKRGRRAKLVWAWRAGAAAAVVAGVVVGVQMWNGPDGGGETQLAQTEQPKPTTPAPMQKGNASEGPSVASALPSVIPAHLSMAPVQTSVPSTQSSMPSAQPSIATHQPEAVAPTIQNPIADAHGVDAPKAEETIVETPLPAVPQNDAPLLAETHTDEAEDFYIVTMPHEKEGGGAGLQTDPTRDFVSRTKRPVSLQLMAMATGEFSQDYDGDASYSIDPSLKNPADSVRMESQRRMNPVGPARSYREVNTRPLYGEHDFPIKVGLTLRVPLSQRFALDAGLSYARMRSELTFFTPEGRRESNGVQQVNYLGVPVALTADLWQNRWWNVYASAGGEVAKSVKTTWRATGGQSYDVDERPWQWSVSAAVGVQFNVTQHVGIYAQPSADYYFDNHSMVQTYYTDHPFMPALRMGVRVKL